MKHIACGLLFDKQGKLLIYLRDNKPGIPFPNCWDLFGGHVEENETAEQALTREVSEELGIELKEINHFRDYEVLEGDAYPNIKHIFWSRLDQDVTDLRLGEDGQELRAISLIERISYNFANILRTIIDDFVAAGKFKDQE
ncbi:MAG: NUDIX domain-containing protein [Patescibacteria group bacterium]|jgi:8-oxo-dGTP diphosphatase